MPFTGGGTRIMGKAGLTKGQEINVDRCEFVVTDPGRPDPASALTHIMLQRITLAGFRPIS
jgi:hypothetical protein